MEITNIICIDGGGTKTFGIKYAKYGNELKIVDTIEINEQSNVLQDREGSIAVLAKVINKLSYSQDTYVYIGVAGFQGYSDKEKFCQELSLLLGIKNLEIGSDIDLFQEAFNIKGKNILLSIFGTGSAHFLTNEDKIFEFGGWGHILGDEGSGYDVGLRMIKQAIKEYEDNLTPILLNEIYLFYKIKDAQELKKIIYPLVDKTIIAAFVSFISKQEKLNNSSYIKNIYRQTIKSTISMYKDFFIAKKISLDEMFIIGGLVSKNSSYQEELFGELKQELKIVKIQLIDLYDFKNIDKDSLNPLTRIAYKKAGI